MDPVFIIQPPIISEKKVYFPYTYTAQDHEIHFQEVVEFSFEPEDTKAIRNLAIATSISYFRLHLAPYIKIKWNLTSTEITFWEWVFRNGFSELVHHNKLSWDITDRIQIVAEKNADESLYQNNTSLTTHAVVGIGGGKDSSLAIEILKKIQIPVLGFATKVRSIPLLKENADALGIDLVETVRTLDSQMLAMKDGVYHGHVPISLIYAMTGVVIASHTRSRYVVVANETSADESNTTWLGRPVNHQWSKTSEFEKKLQAYIQQTIHAEMTYFSILRPYGGYTITQYFTHLCSHVFQSFSSCNKNFTVVSRGTERWCGECAKCVGTYILLTPLMPKEQRFEIFGKHILEDVALLPLTKELLGITPVKPFDCVATTGEMCFAIAQNTEFRESPLGKAFMTQEWDIIHALAKQGEKLTNTVHTHFIPDDIHQKINTVL